MNEVTLLEIDELQGVSDYRSVHKGLRWPAIGSLIFGLVALVFGSMYIAENSINIVLVLIGAFLLTEGIWLLVSPSPKGMIVDGIAYLILAET